LKREKRAGIAHRGGDLETVPDDPAIPDKPREGGRPIARDFLGIEPVESAAERLALVEHHSPR